MKWSNLPLVARNVAAPGERLDAVRKLAASLHCALLFAEDQVCICVNDGLNLTHTHTGYVFSLTRLTSTIEQNSRSKVWSCSFFRATQQKAGQITPLALKLGEKRIRLNVQRSY